MEDIGSLSEGGSSRHCPWESREGGPKPIALPLPICFLKSILDSRVCGMTHQRLFEKPNLDKAECLTTFNGIGSNLVRGMVHDVTWEMPINELTLPTARARPFHAGRCRPKAAIICRELRKTRAIARPGGARPPAGAGSITKSGGQ